MVQMRAQARSARNARMARIRPRVPRPGSFPGAVEVGDYLRRVSEVREKQLAEGSFDCFAKAWDGFCDQGDCAYRDECLILSRIGSGGE